MSDVGLGRAGIVMGLEVSRLARNNADWHRLLEICALADTLILDEDGVYDPASFNDRLLLGLKGTMSEAELHVIKARFRGGILNKARRGEYRCPLPTGFAYDEVGEVASTPLWRSRETIAYFFETFSRGGIGLSDGQGLSQRGALLSRCSRIRNRAPTISQHAADDIDRDPNAEQSALCGRIRLWPAAISASCQMERRSFETVSAMIGSPAFRRPIPRATSPGSTSRQNLNTLKDEWPGIRGRKSLTAAGGERRCCKDGPYVAVAVGIYARDTPLDANGWKPGTSATRAWLARRAELPVDRGRADRQGDRQIDRRSDDAGRGRTGPGDQKKKIEARHDEADVGSAVAPSSAPRSTPISHSDDSCSSIRPTALSPIRSSANGTTSCDGTAPTRRRKEKRGHAGRPVRSRRRDP